MVTKLKFPLTSKYQLDMPEAMGDLGQVLTCVSSRETDWITPISYTAGYGLRLEDNKFSLDLNSLIPLIPQQITYTGTNRQIIIKDNKISTPQNLDTTASVTFDKVTTTNLNTEQLSIKNQSIEELIDSSVTYLAPEYFAGRGLNLENNIFKLKSPVSLLDGGTGRSDIGHRYEVLGVHSNGVNLDYLSIVGDKNSINVENKDSQIKISSPVKSNHTIELPESVGKNGQALVAKDNHKTEWTTLSGTIVATVNEISAGYISKDFYTTDKEALYIVYSNIEGGSLFVGYKTENHYKTVPVKESPVVIAPKIGTKVRYIVQAEDTQVYSLKMSLAIIN